MIYSRLNINPLRLLPLTVAALCVCMIACTIEPPLKLAAQHDIEMDVPEIVTDISVIWDTEVDWQKDWWYGWDADDEAAWGKIEYPEPDDYEVRFYFIGAQPGIEHLKYDGFTILGKSFRRRFDFGYHNMLFWSNIHSESGTQVVIFDESDVTDIQATTSYSRLSYLIPHKPSTQIFNCPEIFYSTHVRDFYVSSDTTDYDYYDQERKVWVRHFSSTLSPMVYTYLIQYVIYNNRGRITGTADDSSVTALSDGVSLHTGYTSDHDVAVTFGMRLKKGLAARDGRRADIIGGKLTTFGLCGMKPWAKSRNARYEGRFGDLRNNVMLKLTFSNSTDSVYAYDITSQLQSKAHGGVITIEIDADTLPIPHPGEGSNAGSFDPTIVAPDTIYTEIEM